jgi:pimeloyl-ACP methyl ester carboxylesterase
VTNTRTYASLIRNARYELLEGTGHIGVLTKPERFATLISDFAHAHTH